MINLYSFNIIKNLQRVGTTSDIIQLSMTYDCDPLIHQSNLFSFSIILIIIFLNILVIYQSFSYYLQ